MSSPDNPTTKPLPESLTSGPFKGLRPQAGLFGQDNEFWCFYDDLLAEKGRVYLDDPKTLALTFEFDQSLIDAVKPASRHFNRDRKPGPAWMLRWQWDNLIWLSHFCKENGFAIHRDVVVRLIEDGKAS